MRPIQFKPIARFVLGSGVLRGGNAEGGLMKGKVGMGEGVIAGVLITAFVGFAFMYGTGMFAVTTPTEPVEGQLPLAPGYTPFELATVYAYLYDSEDPDTTFGGADDAQCRVWKGGQFDFLGPYVDSDSQSATGQIALAAVRLKTGTSYDILCYENDGGTPVYAQKLDFTIPQVDPEKTTWTYDENIELLKEGAFTESACDSATAAFDEAADTVTLNKTAETVQGVLEWDCTVSQSTAGAVVKDPVIIFREAPGTPLTDVNDVEAVWISVKTGSGVSVPAGNLVSEFKSAAPVVLTEDGMLSSADSATITVKIQLPSSEGDVGTGNIEMIYDDLGDYRAKDLDFDVRAAAETTTFVITT